MAKEKISVIALELERFNDKVQQFQNYLASINPLGIDDEKKRQSEIDTQIKIMNALPNWLAALEKLRTQSDATKQVEVRADAELSGLMKLKQKEEK